MGTVLPEFSEFASGVGDVGVLGDVGTWGVDGPALVSACTETTMPSIATANAAANILIVRILYLIALERNALRRGRVPAILNQATTREDAFEFSGGSSDGGGPIKFLARLTFPALSGKIRSTNSISRLMTPSRPSLASDCLM